MLVLTRKPQQSIMIGDDVEVTVLSTRGACVRLGITAPHGRSVYRTEIYEAITSQERRRQGEREAAPASAPQAS